MKREFRLHIPNYSNCLTLLINPLGTRFYIIEDLEISKIVLAESFLERTVSKLHKKPSNSETDKKGVLVCKYSEETKVTEGESISQPRKSVFS